MSHDHPGPRVEARPADGPKSDLVPLLARLLRRLRDRERSRRAAEAKDRPPSVVS
ncbi:MAG TPA: hypothetical protein VFW33_04385 [Gemmataceae bacterium]|nr:hypothetical protein [Gemmataceae bacterium]